MNELAKIVPPYNMNQLSLTAAKFALRHYGWVEEQINTLKRERSRLSEALSLLPEVKVFASEANFLTIRVPDAELVFKALKDSNILIKNLHGSHPLLDQCLRLTVGTFEQNQQVLTVFNIYLTSKYMDKKAIRTENFFRLIKEAGNVSKLSRACGYTNPASLHQLRARLEKNEEGGRGISSVLATKLEQGMKNQRAGWISVIVMKHNLFLATNKR